MIDLILISHLFYGYPATCLSREKPVPIFKELEPVEKNNPLDNNPLFRSRAGYILFQEKIKSL